MGGIGHLQRYLGWAQMRIRKLLEVKFLMLEPRSAHRPTIIYRPILPSDLEALEQIHVSLFPIRYEREFFLNVVRGHGIVSWAAVDVCRSDGRNGELIGFVTTRLVLAKESEIADLIQYNASRKDATLVYILTLGVVEHYRNHGIGPYFLYIH
ncbi:hypothetical protein ZIOFF_075927 [Zingiber officinale]|uniref:histone acetyltransferase n=1 Tax=Zingiber officinale TaxID=94328 RepID=A0A8J5EKK3_ZINOF|nr:hypothetical protein ZIOFF_075927 [Zingiber officinale]